MSVATTLQVCGIQQGYARVPPRFEFSPSIHLRGDHQPLERILIRARQRAEDRWNYVGEVLAQLVVAVCEVNGPDKVCVYNEQRLVDRTAEFPCLIDISAPTWIAYCDRLQTRTRAGLIMKPFHEFTAPDPERPPTTARAATALSEAAPPAVTAKKKTARRRRS